MMGSRGMGSLATGSLVIGSLVIGSLAIESLETGSLVIESLAVESPTVGKVAAARGFRGKSSEGAELEPVEIGTGMGSIGNRGPDLGPVGASTFSSLDCESRSS